jgi:RNase P subunit RPR2
VAQAGSRFTAEYVAWVTDLETHERAQAALRAAGTDGRYLAVPCNSCGAVLPGLYNSVHGTAAVAVHRVLVGGKLAVEIGPQIRIRRHAFDWTCPACHDTTRVFIREREPHVRNSPWFD